MGLFDFVKEAGEKLFRIGSKDAEAAAPEPVQTDEDTAASLFDAVNRVGLEVQDLQVEFSSGVATVSGVATSQAEREKLILVLGNSRGVAQVDDQIRVEKPEPEATMYTVKSGDSLSRIAKEHYGDASRYPVIFEANKPMLSNPDKIYPGQVLRIPPMA